MADNAGRQRGPANEARRNEVKKNCLHSLCLASSWRSKVLCDASLAAQPTGIDSMHRIKMARAVGSLTEVDINDASSRISQGRGSSP